MFAASVDGARPTSRAFWQDRQPNCEMLAGACAHNRHAYLNRMGKLARPVLRGPGGSQDLPDYPTLPANVLHSVEKFGSALPWLRVRHLWIIALLGGGICAAGEIEKVSHIFQPLGRRSALNS